MFITTQNIQDTVISTSLYDSKISKELKLSKVCVFNLWFNNISSSEPRTRCEATDLQSALFFCLSSTSCSLSSRVSSLPLLLSTRLLSTLSLPAHLAAPRKIYNFLRLRIVHLYWKSRFKFRLFAKHKTQGHGATDGLS